MKSTGIVRGIDSLGRIVLPKELRTSMHLDTDTKLEIFVDGDAIVLKKHRPAGSCDFCGEVDEQALQELERAGLVIRRRKAVGAITRTYPLVPVEPGGDAENPLGI